MNNLFIPQFEQVNWAIPEKKLGELRTQYLEGKQRNSLHNFQGLSKKGVEFLGGDQEKSCGFSEVLIFGFGISKDCNTILQNFEVKDMFIKDLSIFEEMLQNEGLLFFINYSNSNKNQYSTFFAWLSRYIKLKHIHRTLRNN